MGEEGGEHTVWVEKAKSYIDEHFTSDLCLERIAAHVGVSPKYLATVFKDKLGRTVITYVTELRLRRAMELLECSGDPIAVVARRVGYQDPHYFTRLFSNRIGLPPGQYRRRVQEATRRSAGSRERTHQEVAS